MKFEIHVHLHSEDTARVLEFLDRIERRMSMDKAQLTQALGDIRTGLSEVGAQLGKATTEITGKLGELSSTATTPEQDAIISSIQDSLGAARDAAQKLDDLVPDAPAEPEAPVAG